ncbi:HlyD family secretion protein [Mucilaginibacter paludis]|uniref:Secretion protein HlyD family protein n=1 Tax=Mucilaginibacter paludis DSM 18603 TaxID=714943 RepID=H1YIF6_9SPHI|nr:HlyD family secretion protein [Mucilaginibacter paludis]EHQ27569.1 secretion protein HlyD family protein [Mucilaginibacter paludis DSM 18603]
MAQEVEQTTTKKPNRVMPIILGLLLIAGIVFGVKEYIYFSKHEDTDDAQIDGDISPVVARVGGYVDSILFEENEHVKQGQLLVKIDPRDYQVKLEQAMAAQKGASATIGVSQSQIYTTAANSSSAKANVETAKVKLLQSKRDYDRYANLVKDGSITQQQFEQAQVTRDAAQAAYQAAQDQYKAALEQVKGTRNQLNVTNTGVTAKQADVDFAKLQLSYTDITSPASGIVSKKNVQKGQLVQAGQTLFSVVNDNSLYITANFKETQLAHLRSGEKVEVEVDGLPGEKIEGEVYNFSPATGAKFSLLPPDNATGNYVKVVQRIPVKIKIKTTPEIMARLRPGMSVTASVIYKN